MFFRLNLCFRLNLILSAIHDRCRTFFCGKAEKMKNKLKFEDGLDSGKKQVLFINYNLLRNKELIG